MLKRLSTPEIETTIQEIVKDATAACGCELTEIHKHRFAKGRTTNPAAWITGAVSCRVRKLIESLVGENDYVQVKPNLRIHMPGEPTAIPFHSDSLSYGHSPCETNYWLTLTPVNGTNSLWMCMMERTNLLHHLSQHRDTTLESFEEHAREYATPIETDTPALFSFCCSQWHGSLPNVTDQTRVSFDIRSIGPNDPQGVKRRGSYFKPKWLKSRQPHPNGPSHTTVASLDVGTPVYLQRQVMREFAGTQSNRELVDFQGIDSHAPTLEDAMAKGPTVAYSIRQIRRPVKILHPVGFADESTWFLPGDEKILERFAKECQ